MTQKITAAGGPYTFTVQVYYEDTDFSGVVYHANYLKFFERARERVIGAQRLAQLWRDGIGFVVYKLEMHFADGAQFGDMLQIHTTWEVAGKYRLNFHQEAWRPDGEKAAVSADIQLVCIDHDRRLRPIPIEYVSNQSADSAK